MTASPSSVLLEHASCALCGDRNATHIYRDIPDRSGHGPHRFDVIRCGSCGLVRTDPRPDRHTIGAYYPEDYAPYRTDDRITSTVPRRLARQLRALPYRLRHGPPWEPAAPPPGANRMLDVGTGAGVYLARHRRVGWDVWGIEPSGVARDAAARRAGIALDRIQPTSAEEADFPEGTFDLILVVHVIEHLHDPLAVLTRVRRWLRPSGRVFIRCPNFASGQRRLFGRNWFPLDVPRHLNHFEPRSMSELLEAAGLTVAYIRPEFDMSALPVNVAALTGILDGRRGRHAYMSLYYALMPLTVLTLALDMPLMETVAMPRTG